MASWWRVEIDAEGKLVSCARVDAGSDRTAGVFYVQAGDAKSAFRFAYNLFNLELLRKRRERYREQGKCRCGRDRDDPAKVRCAVCRSREGTYKARAKGYVPPVKPGAMAQKQAERREEKRDLTRLQVLLEVQRAWQASSTNGAFTRWLNGEIAKSGGKGAAA